MIIAINYANKAFKKSQKLNAKTAIRVGGADKVICYTRDDIDLEFFAKNKSVLQVKRGDGYYLWKPYFMYKAYQELKDGDYLIYTDSGSVYVNRIQYLIDCMEKEDMEIMVFSLENEMLEKKYTKRDAFVLMECDCEEYANTPQSIGGYVLLKKSRFVEKFLSEDLAYAQDSRIITEEDNTQGLDNYPEFIAHRHDQSVWSLMSKKYHLKRFRDPSQFGLVRSYEKAVEERSFYPQIIDSHRMGNIQFMWQIKFNRNKYVQMIKYKIFLWKNKK